MRDQDGAIAGLPGFSIKRKATKTHCGGFAIVTTRGTKTAVDDELLAAMFKIEFPRGLTFDSHPQHKARNDAAMKKFKTFMASLTKVGGDARKHYEDKLSGSTDAAVKIAATARVAQIMTRFASVLARAEIPASVLKGAYAAEATKAYCDKLVEVAEPIYEQAELAMQSCAESAKQAGLTTGWWTAVCVAP